jgi:uncharacterized small protein (DUF1192 family)
MKNNIPHIVNSGASVSKELSEEFKKGHSTGYAVSILAIRELNKKIEMLEAECKALREQLDASKEG